MVEERPLGTVGALDLDCRRRPLVELHRGRVCLVKLQDEILTLSDRRIVWQTALDKWAQPPGHEDNVEAPFNCGIRGEKDGMCGRPAGWPGRTLQRIGGARHRPLLVNNDDLRVPIAELLQDDHPLAHVLHSHSHRDDGVTRVGVPLGEER
jgi:hypothetical protein